jgi:stearoyl-CoA desaturase (delta-9 desaturase)
MSPYAYGVMHRLHHVHTDDEEDPHSPLFYPGLLRTMMRTRNSYHGVFTGKTIVEDKFKKDLPKWESFETIAHNWITRVIWIMLYIVFYIAFATSWWMYLLLPVTIIMCTLQGAMINWWAHTFGYVNYPMENASKNILPIDLLFIGDAYHNNHHKYPGNPNNSHRWFEFDAIYQILRLMNKMRIIKLKTK